jgi:hypothetical protein
VAVKYYEMLPLLNLQTIKFTVGFLFWHVYSYPPTNCWCNICYRKFGETIHQIGNLPPKDSFYSHLTVESSLFFYVHRQIVFVCFLQSYF